eukprot:1159784-Pelagomonas_calceolata.AAC.16
MKAEMRLLEQDIEVSESMSPAIPEWDFLILLVPLPGSKATLMSSLCALSQENLPSLILLRSLLKTKTTTLLKLISAPDTNPFPTLEAATARHASTTTLLLIPYLFYSLNRLSSQIYWPKAEFHCKPCKPVIIAKLQNRQDHVTTYLRALSIQKQCTKYSSENSKEAQRHVLEKTRFLISVRPDCRSHRQEASCKAVTEFSEAMTPSSSFEHDDTTKKSYAGSF